MKFLFIDDDADLLQEMTFTFRNCPNVFFVVCHSVADALQAITSHQPDVLFLDHHLDKDSMNDDGFAIVEQLNVRNVTIYSTTTRDDKKEAYKRRGIESVGKSDVAALREIVASTTLFANKADEAMDGMIQNHQPRHSLFDLPGIKELVIDYHRKLALWVFYEQIDTDRTSPTSLGTLGDQFRFSLWKMNGDGKPVQIYEDHAYMRLEKNEMTGTRGRDCELRNLRLEGSQAKVDHRKGERVEQQTWEELVFAI